MPPNPILLDWPPRKGGNLLHGSSSGFCLCTMPWTAPQSQINKCNKAWFIKLELESYKIGRNITNHWLCLFAWTNCSFSKLKLVCVLFGLFYTNAFSCVLVLRHSEKSLKPYPGENRLPYLLSDFHIVGATSAYGTVEGGWLI